MDVFLYQATIFLVAMVIAVSLASRMELGSVLGYLMAGVMIGPVLGLMGSTETQSLQHVAEFGVVMVLFIIGLGPVDNHLDAMSAATRFQQAA